MSASRLPIAQNVSIHAPARGATSSPERFSLFELFQSTLPRGERRDACGGIFEKNGFNPRSREGSDLQLPQLALDVHVSIHAPARGATAQVRDARAGACFNPRSREGSDPTPYTLHLYGHCFNPRSREGSDTTRLKRTARSAFQSTLPRGERRGEDVLAPCVRVSIHAPARGATSKLSPFRRGLEVSIHAPARGATLRQGATQRGKSFNPRSREGSDSSRSSSPSVTRFQSTLPRGERHPLSAAPPLYPLFQSTLPRGERLAQQSELFPVSGFNPRSREGSDRKSQAPRRRRRFQSTLPRGERPVSLQEKMKDLLVSIHAPARGATRAAGAAERVYRVSIHAPARGATSTSRHRRCSPSFNPRSREGSDAAEGLYYDALVFQSTLPRGERQTVEDLVEPVGGFNPRSREGSDSTSSQ